MARINCPGRSDGCFRTMAAQAFLCNICASKVPDGDIIAIGAAIDAGDKATSQQLINTLLAYLRTV